MSLTVLAGELWWAGNPDHPPSGPGQQIGLGGATRFRAGPEGATLLECLTYDRPD